MTEFFDYIAKFFSEGIYDFTTEAFAHLILYLTLAKIKAMIFMVGFAWDVAGQILIELRLTETLNTYIGQLDSKALNLLHFFRVFDGLDLIARAGATKFVLRFLGL